MFYLKSSFHFKGIKIFVLTFWSCRKKDLIKKVNFEIYDVTTWLTNNQNTHIAQHFTKKVNQTIKFGQLIEYNKRNIFIQKIFEWETSSRPPFFCLKKRTSHEVKASGLNLDSIYTYSDCLNLAYNKNKLHETLDY